MGKIFFFDSNRIFDEMKHPIDVLWYQLPGGYQFIKLELYKEGMSIGECRKFGRKWRVKHNLSMAGD